MTNTNPHAVTGLGGLTYAYDNNSNLSSKGSWVYTWDYQNYMTSAGNGTATSTYAYDHTGQRIQKASGGITTVYPTKYYNTTTATSTEHIFTPSGELIATFIGTGTATTTQYIHTDHLGGTGVVTDTNGDQIELTDYYPYGAQRINEGTTVEQRKFTGHEYDTDTDLTYANARYYDQGMGRFNSQDPAFLAVGDGSQIQQITHKKLQQYLVDPQELNSYAYARNNPIVRIDSTGEASTLASIFNPLVSVFKIGAFGAKLFGRPATAELLSRSASLNPSDTYYAGNGSNVVNAIQNSFEYQRSLDKAIQSSISEGSNAFSSVLSLNFRSGDSQTAIGKIDLHVNGSMQENGFWNISANGRDTYDFASKNYGSSYNSKIVGAAANIGVVGQKTDALSTFTTNVSFTQTINNEKEK